jgi:CRISPR-associated protein Csx16
MARNIIVSRHPATIELIKHSLDKVDQVSHHFDTDDVREGDCIYGNLTAHLIASVCARGGRYFHIQISLPESLRGKELSRDQMISLNPQIVEISATVVGVQQLNY